MQRIRLTVQARVNLFSAKCDPYGYATEPTLITFEISPVLLLPGKGAQVRTYSAGKCVFLGCAALVKTTFPNS